MMILKIMFCDKDIIETIKSVTRVASMNNGKYLYYETVNHMKGNGVIIPFSDVKCFEVTNVVNGVRLW